MNVLQHNIGRRFLLLTVIGYLSAVLVAAMAVKLASGPLLRDMQQSALQDQAAALATGVERELTVITKGLSHLLGHAEVIHAVSDGEADAGHEGELLASFGDLSGLIRMTLHDLTSQRIFDQTAREEVAQAFFEADIASMAARVLAAPDHNPIVNFRPAGGSLAAQFLIGLPVLQNDRMTGVAVFEMLIDAGRVFEARTQIGTARLATAFQVDMAPDWFPNAEGEVIAPISGSSVFLVLEPEAEAVAKIGSELVSRVLRAVCLFLTLPFGLMCAAGYRAIITPHQALAASREELKKNQNELRELAAVAEHSNDAILVTDLKGLLIWTNAATEVLTGYSRECLIGKNPGRVLQGPGTDMETRDKISESLRNLQPVRTEILNYRRDGTPYWTSISISPLTDDSGEVYRFVGITADISESKRQQEALLATKRAAEHEAYHDHLTGLANRRGLDLALEKLKTAPDEGRILIRIDLDHFKTVNDTMGHAAGDHVLKEVGGRLLAHVGQEDLVARVGGDEFVILLAPECSPVEARTLAASLLEVLQQQMNHEGQAINIGASFGIVDTREGHVGTGDLLLSADAALYAAKERGRNLVVHYSPQLHAEVVRTRRLSTEIEEAIEKREFEPFFQPQFDATTRDIVGVEALARWRHPSRGILSPADFLPVAEQLGLIEKIDEIIFTRGLKAVAELQSSRLHVPKVAFNIGANRLENGELANIAANLSTNTTKIALEVLESVLVEEQSQLFQFQVDRLKDLGIQFEVDDFGSGHASIIGLMHLQPDVMKIDRRLVVPTPTSETARKMVRSIVEIGRTLDISITAEGVETEKHAEILAELGCETLQGYFFARPMPIKDLAVFLRAHGNFTRPQAVAASG